MSILTVELPDSLSQKIEELARKDGIPVNKFIASAAAEKMAVFLDTGFLEREVARADRKAFEEILRRVPDVPPDSGDEMPER